MDGKVAKGSTITTSDSQRASRRFNFVQGLKCILCGATYSNDVPYTCPSCGIAGILDVQYDYPAISRSLSRRALRTRRAQTHWRYHELLPVRSDAILPNLPVGMTPLTKAPALARHLGIEEVFLKDDGRNPTGSLKDRASAIGVVKALEGRKKIVACASTGNAASSLAGMAASVGLRSVIFIPQRAPEPKVVQLLVFGATVLRVQGSYEDAYQLCQKSCERWGWYNRNCAINPYLMEGKKTVALEACEQLDWTTPDWVAVSIGDGCTIAAVWKAFRELKILGLIERVPKMLGVQAAGSAPISTAFRNNEEVVHPVNPHTLADSIAVGMPRNWKKAISAIRESDGAVIDVSDDEILDAIAYTGRLTGVFAEPAAATAVAGVRRAVSAGVIGSRAIVLTLITGSGLKDIRSAQTAVGQPHNVEPGGSDLEDIVNSSLAAP